MRKFLTLIFVVLSLFVWHSYANDKNFNQINKNYNVKLEIFDGAAKVTDFMVALADNDEKRMYGLMNLPNLSPKKGMLFIFGEPAIINMWMKNTLISLDMIFIDQNNKIIKIQNFTTPQSLDVISSEKKVNKVLEINGGLSKKYNLKVGQIIKYESSKN